MTDPNKMAQEKSTLEACPRISESTITGSDTSESDADKTIVKFTLPKDPENPKDWSIVRKWLITTVLCLTGFTRILVSTIMAPALPKIAADLHMSAEQTLLSMTIYLLATAIGPLVISPLSELYGRQPILHSTNVLFLVANLVCGFANSEGVLMAGRFFAGLGAGAGYMLSGSVLGDVWDAEDRGKSIGFSFLVQNLASAVGPILGAVITQHTNWHWIFWSTSIFQGGIVIASFLIFRETYIPLILQRKAARLREETGNQNLSSSNEKLIENRSPRWVLQHSLSRPLRLHLHPIVIIYAVLSSFSYGITYLVQTTYSELFTSIYHESLSTSGLHYLALCIGAVIGSQTGGMIMDFIFRTLKRRSSGKWTPEFHLPLLLPGSIIMAAGLIWYGWSTQTHTPWISVDLGSATLNLGQAFLSFPLQAYIIDVYPDHASSAQATVQFWRSMFAFVFPLFGPSLYARMGYGWSNTLLALITLGLGISSFVLLWTRGQKIRESAKASF